MYIFSHVSNQYSQLKFSKFSFNSFVTSDLQQTATHFQPNYENCITQGNRETYVKDIKFPSDFFVHISHHFKRRHFISTHFVTCDTETCLPSVKNPLRHSGKPTKNLRNFSRHVRTKYYPQMLL